MRSVVAVSLRGRLRDLRRYRRSRQLKIIREYKCFFLTCVLPLRLPFAPSRWLAPPPSAPGQPDENTSLKSAIPYTIQKNETRALAKRSYNNRKIAARSLSRLCEETQAPGPSAVGYSDPCDGRRKTSRHNPYLICIHMVYVCWMYIYFNIYI